MAKNPYPYGIKPSSRRSLTCRRCGNVWTPRTKSPKRCPYCGSPRWNRIAKRSAPVTNTEYFQLREAIVRELNRDRYVRKDDAAGRILDLIVDRSG